MDHNEAHGKAADSPAGHKMLDSHGSHDRHAGHSVAMFRDKFWLSFSNENDLLAFAAAVEGNSEHPLAKAIVAEAKRRNLPALQAANFEALPGRGAKALVNGKKIEIGGPRLLTEGIYMPKRGSYNRGFIAIFSNE